MIQKPLISALLVLAFSVPVPCGASELQQFPEPVVAVSPTDGSVWMGTSSEGLLRFGRNGRSLRYTAAEGQLPSDEILSLAFDASGTLFILDGSGALTRFSSTEGFSPVPSFGSEVQSLGASADHTYIYITRGGKQYALSGSSVSELPSVSETSGPEPEEAQPAPGKNASFPAWLLFVLGLALGSAVPFLFKRRVKKEQPVAPVVAAPVVKMENPAPVTPSASPEEGIEQALKNSSFGRQVWDLLVSHLSNPAYGVEEVARDLELSRIHVNRKLKAETGYSPSAVFKFIRMDHASKLLLDGKLSVADVARECGFSSASYFSTAFKEYYSQSPSEFLAESNHPAL